MRGLRRFWRGSTYTAFRRNADEPFHLHHDLIWCFRAATEKIAVTEEAPSVLWAGAEDWDRLGVAESIRQSILPRAVTVNERIFSRRRRRAIEHHRGDRRRARRDCRMGQRGAVQPRCGARGAGEISQRHAGLRVAGGGARRTGSAKPRFRAACLGMSGGPDDKAALLAELIDTAHLVVTHDAAIALAGATAGEPGIITIAGTGSMAFGKNARGETARAGGWGYVFGDEGGAFDVVRQALRAVLREHEGWGGRTALTPALLEATGAPDANAMLHLFYTPEWPRSRVAGLAKTVHRIAEEGDPAAREVLQRGAQQLALLAASVRRQLWGEGEAVRVVLDRRTFQQRHCAGAIPHAGRTGGQRDLRTSAARPGDRGAASRLARGRFRSNAWSRSNRTESTPEAIVKKL